MCFLRCTSRPGRESDWFLRLTGRVVCADGYVDCQVGRADSEVLEVGFISRRDIAPVEAHRLERRFIRYMAPLFKDRIECEDAYIQAVVTTNEHVMLRQQQVQGHGGQDFDRNRELRVDGFPRDGVYQRAIGRNPAAHDTVIALVAQDEIRLTQRLVANDPQHDVDAAVRGHPADAEFEVGLEDVMTVYPKTVSVNL